MKFKTAMTLGETLLVFIIIGIIASFTMSSVRPWEKPYKNNYMNIYNALNLAVYNYKLTTSSFPSTTTDLCTALLDKNNGYLNIAKDVNCATVSAANPAVLSNGIKIWFGSPMSKDFTVGDATETIKFFHVFVDLNGDLGPNTSAYTKNRPADIVALAVTNRDSVIPLGCPQVDIRYLQVQFVTPATSEEDEEEVSDYMTYYEAKKKAYAAETPSEPMSLDYDWESTGNYAIGTQCPAPTGIELDSSCEIPEDMSEPVCYIKIPEFH